MSANAEVEAVETNGKPAKGAPVIRRVEVAEEDVGSRVLNRHVPAWVISGAIHVVVIGSLVGFMHGPQDVKAKENNPVTTQVDEPNEEQKNLTNADVGFDADLAATTNANREENVNVDAKPAQDPVGLPEQPSDIAPNTAAMGLMQDAGIGSKDLSDTGLTMAGPGGGASAFMTPGMSSRVSGATRDRLLKTGGGNTESEAAVAAGLKWLARKQLKDGSWEFDGASKNKIAATGMALLPFLAAGETHKYGTSYKKTVENGLNFLTGRLGSSGTFQGVGGAPEIMYAHAIATVALCEAAGMTRDPAVKTKATAAVNFIVRAQAKNGSWGYVPNVEGDTSIVGWQIQALASARLAEIKFEKDKVYKEANKFLESVSDNSGSTYGYKERGKAQGTTAIGLLSRYYMGELNPRQTAFGRGVDHLKNFPPTKTNFDMYYYYYATQVVHFYEGPDWHKFWNPKMRDMLISMQRKGDEEINGSWDKDSSFIGLQCGRLGTTCFALLTLEVYYRHLPLYKRDSGGLMELEK